MNLDEARQQRINDCRELYLKYEGQHHELIEQEMRERGHHDFHRRSLYRRFERDRCTEGWIGQYGFDSLVREQKRRAKKQSEPPASAGGTHPGCESLLTGRAGSGLAPAAEPASADAPVGAVASFIPAARCAISGPPAYAGGSDSSDFDEFQTWLKRVSPAMTWDWKHQVYIYKRLKMVTDGTCNRLMIFLPPRHGKSELVTVRYSAWRLKQDPSLNIILGSYAQPLANRFSRKIRRVLTEDASEMRNAECGVRNGEELRNDECGARNGEVRNTECGMRNRNKTPHSALRIPHSDGSVFPFISSKPANSVAEWETSQGGGLRAVGVGGGVTGFGAKLIVIDDPIKSRAQAESETFRENVWDWFNDDLYTRLEPDGAIILIQTRWHEDDLAGRLLREAAEEGGEQWEVVNLPALAEAEPPASAGGTDSMGMKAGRDRDAGLRTFSAAVGGAEPPASAGGTLSTGMEARRDRDAGVQTLTPASRKAESVPPAYAGGSDPLGRALGEALCPERFDEAKLEMVRKKLGSYSFAALYQQRPVPAEGGLFKRAWLKTFVPLAPPGLKWKRGYDLGLSGKSGADYTASLRVAYDREGNLYIDGGFRARLEYPDQRRYILGRIESEADTEHGVELSANGHAVIQDLRSDIRVRGQAFRGVAVKGDKITRALPWLALAEAGQVMLVRGAWNSEFIDEACSFPSGTHDDQIDAVSIAVRMHAERKGRLYGF